MTSFSLDTSYPLPSSAMAIWLTSEALHLAIPGTNGVRGHVLAIPIGRLAAPGDIACLSGWSALLALLKDRRQSAEEGTRASIGTRAAPVQYDLDEVLRGMGRSTAPRYDETGKPNSCEASDIGLGEG